jgi:hypothetical protein
MKRDTALPYILAEDFLVWWKEMGEPEVRAAFTYWADRRILRGRRRDNVWRRLTEMRKITERSAPRRHRAAEPAQRRPQP